MLDNVDVTLEDIDVLVDAIHVMLECAAVIRAFNDVTA
jgi:hypothetical protein